MTTLSLMILPVLNRAIAPDKSHSHHLREAGTTTEDPKLSTHKLTLNVAKRIWAAYSTIDLTKKTVETEPAQSANALALNLGLEGPEVDNAASASGKRDMTSRNSVFKGDGDTMTIGVAQHNNSPLSERAVDELLATPEDAMTTIPLDNQPVYPRRDGNIVDHESPLRSGLDGENAGSDNRRPDLHFNRLASQPRASSSLDASQRNLGLDQLSDMRGALMQPFHKAIHLRYPKLNVDRDKLEERFTKKLTDTEVQDFIRMGRAVVEDLRRSGKLEEVKRKLATHDMEEEESEVRRIRRWIDKTPSPVSAEDSRTMEHAVVHRLSELSVAGGTLQAPEAMLAAQNHGLFVASDGREPERPSVAARNVMEEIPKAPSHHSSDNVSMLLSPVPEQPAGLPHFDHSSIPTSFNYNKNVDILLPPHSPELPPRTGKRRNSTPSMRSAEPPSHPRNDDIPMSISPPERPSGSLHPEHSSIILNPEHQQDIDIMLPHSRREPSPIPEEQKYSTLTQDIVPQESSEPPRRSIGDVPMSISPPKQSPGEPHSETLSIPTDSKHDKEERKVLTPTLSGALEGIFKYSSGPLIDNVSMSMSSSPEELSLTTDEQRLLTPSHSGAQSGQNAFKPRHLDDDVLRWMSTSDQRPPGSPQFGHSSTISRKFDHDIDVAITAESRLETSLTTNEPQQPTPMCDGVTPQEVSVQRPPGSPPGYSAIATMPGDHEDVTILPLRRPGPPPPTDEQIPSTPGGDVAQQGTSNPPSHPLTDEVSMSSASVQQPAGSPYSERSYSIAKPSHGKSITISAHGGSELSPITDEYKPSTPMLNTSQQETSESSSGPLTDMPQLDGSPHSGYSPGMKPVHDKDVTTTRERLEHPPTTVKQRPSTPGGFGGTQQVISKSPLHKDDVSMSMSPSFKRPPEPRYSGVVPIILRPGQHENVGIPVKSRPESPVSTVEHRPSTSTHIESTQLGTSQSQYLRDAVPMSMSPSIQRPPGSPRPGRPSTLTNAEHHWGTLNPHSHLEPSSTTDEILEGGKRKLVTQDRESEVKRNRRRLDSCPLPVATNESQYTDRVAASHPGDDMLAVGRSLRASSVMLAGQNRLPFITSSSHLPERPPREEGQQEGQEGSTPPSHSFIDDVSMMPSVQRQPGSSQFISEHHKGLSISPHGGLEAAPVIGGLGASQTIDKRPQFTEPVDDATMEIDVGPSDLRPSQVLLEKVGQPMADILDASFDVDEHLFNAVRRWAQRWKEYVPSRPHIRLYLTCIPTAAAEAAHRALPPNCSPSLLAESVAKIGVKWPPFGTFYISMNEGQPEAMSWAHFGPSSPPLDISNAVVSGKNTIRFIQLADHSQWAFFILAMPPSESEKQRLVPRSIRSGEDASSSWMKVQFWP